MTYNSDDGLEYRAAYLRDSEASAVERIMAMRKAAMLHRGQVSTDTTTAEYCIQERMDAGFNLATHMTSRSAALRNFIQDTGGDPELHELHSYIKLAATEAIVQMMKGRRS